MSLDQAFRTHASLLSGHSGKVSSVAFSPDSARLASGSSDKTVRLWDGLTGAEIARLEGHSGEVNSVTFSSDGMRLASGSDDRTARLWDGVTGKEIAKLEGHSGWIRPLMFSPDGTRLVSGSYDQTVRIWDGRTGALIAVLYGHFDWVNSITLSSDGTRLATGSDDNTVRLWNGTTGEQLLTLEGHTDEVDEVAFSPDDTILASGSNDWTIRLWKVATGEDVAMLQGHSGRVWSIGFSLDGTRLASGSNDKTIRLWDVVSGEHVATLEGHSGWVVSVKVSPDGKLLASASFDKTVRLWDMLTGAPIAAFDGHSDRVRSIAFSSDSARIISGSDDGTIRLWDSAVSGTFDLTGTTLVARDTISNPSTTDFSMVNDISNLVTLAEGSRIGFGGFGDLFLGTHSERGKVALKRPHLLLTEPSTIRRFLRETDLWCKVSHPNILPFLGTCRISQDVYMVSPFIENGDLASCIRSGHILDRSKILCQIADAIHHLHKLSIVHGDIKAQNVLVSDEGSALLCDFGLAKAFDTMVTSTEVKGVGSVRWMAPELFDEGSKTTKSDVYSFGMTIAEVLSGQPPFPKISGNMAVMFHILQNEARPPKEPLIGPGGKPYHRLWQTAERCWVTNAHDRPSMVEIIRLLAWTI